jgi:FK506-binding protein 1
MYIGRGAPGARSVIKGWDEGVAAMKLGETARLTCTADYGYGAEVGGSDACNACIVYGGSFES